MVFQKDRELNRFIQNSGCNMLSLLFIAQLENKKVMSVTDVNNLYKYFLDKKYIDKDCTVLKPDEIFKTVLIGKKIHQVGSIVDDKESYWSWVSPQYQNFDWTIACHKTPGKEGKHFIACDKYFNEFYDPLLGRGYQSLGIERYLLYKIF